MSKESAAYRPAAPGESIPEHNHHDIGWVSSFAFLFGAAALLIIAIGFSSINTRADRDRDVICAVAVKYPEFTLSDCPNQDSVRITKLRHQIEQLRKALEEMEK